MKKLNQDDIWQMPVYSSILTLIEEFGGKKGLEPKHIRYCLMERHGDLQYYPSDDHKLLTQFQIDQDKLDELIKEKLVTENCIKSNALLSQFLKNLKDMKLIVENKRYKKVPRYKLVKRSVEEITRDRHISFLKFYSKNDVIFFNNKANILYGFERQMYEEFPGIKETVNNHISEINEHLNAIGKIRDDLVKDTGIRLRNKINQMISKTPKEPEKKKLRKALDVILNAKEIPQLLIDQFYADNQEFFDTNEEYDANTIAKIRPTVIKIIQNVCKLNERDATSLTDFYYEIISDDIWAKTEGLIPIGFSRYQTS